ncbi:hypothetical protein XENOCAPTIV_030800 [Xenoophorus captivus]|uniref:UBP-type domain-containing protein n=1 Tax=Xenoophorus captivus TaxID=1517983 RepID=A0ABV0R734_9TELE
MAPASSCDCPHLDCVGEITKEELIEKSHGQCQDCKVRGPNLWACLENGCAYVGCGESHADHSTVHSQVRDLSAFSMYFSQQTITTGAVVFNMKRLKEEVSLKQQRWYRWKSQKQIPHQSPRTHY